MAMLECEVSEGLRNAEATVKVVAYDGRPEFMPVARAFLRREGDKDFLPVAVIHIDEPKGAALVSLPLEADSGANRIWVNLIQLRDYKKESVA